MAASLASNPVTGPGDTMTIGHDEPVTTTAGADKDTTSVTVPHHNVTTPRRLGDLGECDDTDATAWQEVISLPHAEDMPPRFVVVSEQSGREPLRLRLAEFMGGSS